MSSPDQNELTQPGEPNQLDGSGEQDSHRQGGAEHPLSSDFLATVSHGSGVYQMLGRREVLYVGKARDLRKRLAQNNSYILHGVVAIDLQIPGCFDI